MLADASLDSYPLRYDNSEQKKIGPGLKGLAKRGTFSVNGNKITDESLKALRNAARSA